MSHRVRIAGTGSYVPERVLTNADLERIVETTDEWIRTRTGIGERRIAAEGEATSDMAAAAGRRACEAAGISPEDLDLIIVGTFTADRPLPSCACETQAKLGAVQAAAFDLAAACSGFIYGLACGVGFITSGQMERVLVIGAEKLSSVTDYEDRATCVLFGDGAGAAVLVPSDDDSGVLWTQLGADGTGADLMYISAGGSRSPITHEAIDARDQFVKMRGNETFKFAVSAMKRCVEEAMAAADLSIEDVGMIVPHQVNTRIIDAAIRRLGVPVESIALNIEQYGNTSAASAPIALDEYVRAGRIVKGDNVILVAFGGGLTWATAVLRW